MMDKKYKNLHEKLNRLEKKQTNPPCNYNHNFHPREMNHTNINFSSEELELLNKGLKYNLNHKKKSWIKDLATEAKTAITKIQSADQDYVRCLVARNIEQLYRQYNSNKNHYMQKTYAEMHTINSIKAKLSDNNVMILRAEKGNTIVVCHTNDHYSKTEEFILNNQFSNIRNDPTNAFQKEIRKIVNRCSITIHKEKKWKYINLNPSASSMKGLPKIHKTGLPI